MERIAADGSRRPRTFTRDLPPPQQHEQEPRTDPGAVPLDVAWDDAEGLRNPARPRAYASE